MSRPMRPVPASAGRIYAPLHDNTSPCRDSYRGLCVVLFVLSVSLLALAAVVLMPLPGKVLAAGILLAVALRTAFMTGRRGAVAMGRI